jgi:hypothetical protein
MFTIELKAENKPYEQTHRKNEKAMKIKAISAPQKTKVGTLERNLKGRGVGRQ